MKWTIVSLLLVFGVTMPLAAQPCTTLQTTFQHNNGQAGNMFDIKAVNTTGVIIRDFDINLDQVPPVNVDVYIVTGGGSFAGNETNAAAWTLVGTAMGVVSNGPGVPTPLGLSLNVQIPAGATQGFYVTVTGGSTAINYTNGSTQGALFASNADIEFYEGVGKSWPFGATFSPRVWNGNIHYSLIGVPLPWQTNQPEVSLTIDGNETNGCAPVVVNKTAILCTPPIPATAAMTLDSTLGATGTHEIVFSAQQVTSPFQGGVMLPDGQAFNLDLQAPLGFFNGGVLPLFLPFPPLPVTTTVQTTSVINATLQAVVTNPAALLGISLSQATEFHVIQSASQQSVAGPVNDDSSVTVSFTQAPTCWAPGGMPFYGTTYTEMHVSSNGRVVFGGPDVTATPTVVQALGGNPFVGLWTNFAPNLGGTITINNTQPGIFQVAFNGVAYFFTGQASSFTIEFDATSGVIIIGGLGGVVPNPSGADLFLGLSPGAVGGATDPGSLTFLPGTLGAAAQPTDMLYEFGPSPLLSITSGLNQIILGPDGSGNYIWSAQ